MKITVKVNIGGLVFHLDEDAYKVLKNYLDTIHARFRNEDEGAEIIEDIENRIAEVFSDKKTPENQAITIDDVNDVINQLGEPEEIADEEQPDSSFKQPTGEPGYNRARGKRLYRDPENAILGGVSSGLGAYFRIDPVLFRVLFIVFLIAYGFTAIIYLILWIVVPPAKTASQRLEMRGEEVNISNIERSIKDEYHKVRTNLNKMASSREMSNFKKFLNEFFRILGVLIIGLAKALLIIIGIALVMGGVAIIVFILSAWFFKDSILPGFTGTEFFGLHKLIENLTTSTDPTLLLIALLIVIGVPLFFLIYGGLKIIFRFKTRDKTFGVVAFVLWILAVMALSAMVFIEGLNYTSEANHREKIELSPTPEDTLFIQLNNKGEMSPGNLQSWVEFDDFILTNGKNAPFILYKPDMRIKESRDNKWEITLEKESTGRTYYEAERNAEQLVYEWVLKDSLLLLDQYYHVPEDEPFRYGDLDITLLVPEYTVIYIGPGLKDILRNMSHEDRNFEWELEHNFWQMRNNKLIKLE